MCINTRGTINLLQYGLQRSGTNFLEALLKVNYQVRFLHSAESRSSPHHKHCRFYRNKKIIPEPKYLNDIFIETFEQFESLLEVVPDYYLIVSKDPYSWCLSYSNWGRKCNWPEVSHHYIEEYNLFYGTFKKLSSQSNKFVFVRYLDLIEGTHDVLVKLEKRMKLKKKSIGQLAYKVPGKVSQSESFTDAMRDYYVNEKYLEEYSVKNITKLNGLLDTQVASFLGYDLKDIGN